MKVPGGARDQIGAALLLDALVWGIGGVFQLETGLRWFRNRHESVEGLIAFLLAPAVIVWSSVSIVVGLVLGWVAFRMVRGRLSLGWPIVLVVAVLGAGYALNLLDARNTPPWELVLWICAAAAHILAVVGAVGELRSRDATVAPGP